MKLYLNVSFEEKDEAKAHGAKWNPKLKLWYVELQDSLDEALHRWLIQESDYSILADNYSIVMAKKSCWKCEKEMPVTTFLLDRYYQLDEYEDSDLGLSFFNWQETENESFVSNITALDHHVLTKMQTINPHYKKTYSKTLKGSYYANNCPHCGMLQGDFNLYQEPGSVFYDSRDASKFTIMMEVEAPFKAEGNTAFIAGSVGGIMIKIVGI